MFKGFVLSHGLPGGADLGKWWALATDRHRIPAANHQLRDLALARNADAAIERLA